MLLMAEQIAEERRFKAHLHLRPILGDLTLLAQAEGRAMSNLIDVCDAEMALPGA